jgi:hypothetical protein
MKLIDSKLLMVGDILRVTIDGEYKDRHFAFKSIDEHGWLVCKMLNAGEIIFHPNEVEKVPLRKDVEL